MHTHAVYAKIRSQSTIHMSQNYIVFIYWIHQFHERIDWVDICMFSRYHFIRNLIQCFGSPLKEKTDDSNVFRQVQPEDLRKFGLIPEFIGRLPVMATVEQLDKPALISILTEPKNALVKQYQRMFEIDGFELEFEPAAIEMIADLAVERETGARGLRAILEELLSPIMFELPGSAEQGLVVITADNVENHSIPKIRPLPQRLKDKSA